MLSTTRNRLVAVGGAEVVEINGGEELLWR
jgi:hypothetical protein